MKLTLDELQNLESEMLKEVSTICKNNNITYFIAYGTCIGAVRHEGPIPWDPDVDIIVPYPLLDKFVSIVRANLSDRFFVDFHDINPYYTATFPRVGLKGYSTAILHIDVFIACGLPKAEKDRAALIKKTYRLRKKHYYKLVSQKYRGKMSVKQNILNLFFKILYLPQTLTRIRKNFYSICNEHSYHSSEYITNPSGGYGAKEIIPKMYLGIGRPLDYTDFSIAAPEEIDLYLKHFYGDYMSLPPHNQRQTKESYHIHPLELN